MKKSILFTLVTALLLTFGAIGDSHGQAKPEEEVLHSKVVSVTSAQLLASNTTPVVLVTAPNSNYLVIPVSIVCDFDYKGTAYATNTTLNAGYGTGTVLLTGSISLAVTADTITTLNTAISGARSALIGKSLVLKTATGNPATGTGTARVYVQYRLLNITSGGY